MRSCFWVLLLAALAPAEDAVELRRGGELRGTVTATSGEVVVLAMASGEIRLPRGEVARIRRDVARTEGPARRIRRDEWSFLVRDGAVVGWARVLHAEQGDRVSVEERRVVFRPREDRRRVEISRRDGTPVEYLWIESSETGMEVWSGQVEGGEHVRQHRHGGEIETATAPWPEGARLPLCVWSAVRLGGARPEGRLYDPRLGRTRDLAVADTPVADWAGEILPTTAARVAFAQRVHAPADVREVARDAMLHPLTPRSKERRVHHLAGGFSLTVPHERWVGTKHVRPEGDLLTLENRVTFARVEVATTPLPDPTITAHEALRRARTRLALVYDWFAPIGEPSGEGARLRQRVEIRRGTERWQGVLLVEKRDARVFTVLGLAPLRTWALERRFLDGVLDSFRAVE